MGKGKESGNNSAANYHQSRRRVLKKQKNLEEAEAAADATASPTRPAISPSGSPQRKRAHFDAYMGAPGSGHGRGAGGYPRDEYTGFGYGASPRGIIDPPGVTKALTDQSCSRGDSTGRFLPLNMDKSAYMGAPGFGSGGGGGGYASEEYWRSQSSRGGSFGATYGGFFDPPGVAKVRDDQSCYSSSSGGFGYRSYSEGFPTPPGVTESRIGQPCYSFGNGGFGYGSEGSNLNMDKSAYMGAPGSGHGRGAGGFAREEFYSGPPPSRGGSGYGFGGEATRHCPTCHCHRGQ